MKVEEYRSLYDVLRHTEESGKANAFKTYMFQKTMAVRAPLSAVFELSPICNLACKMCYIRKTPSEVKNLGGLLPLEKWKKIIDECCKIGVLSFTLTGGECLLHPDFFEIYNYIYERTPKVILMTNSALISDEHIELFIRRPPSMIVTTIYGASRVTYGQLCGNPDAYDQVMNALKRLKEIGVNLKLQTTVVRENLYDLPEIVQLAKRLNVPYGFMDSLVTFGNTDDVLRAAEETKHSEVISVLEPVFAGTEVESKVTEKEFVDFRRRRGKPLRPGLRCASGRNTLTITWQGEMKPCTVLDAYKVSVLENDFGETWGNMVKWADSLNVLPECYTCLFAARCVPCIAHHYNDTHDFSKPSPRLCWKQLHPEEAAKLEAEYEAKMKEEEF